MKKNYTLKIPKIISIFIIFTTLIALVASAQNLASNIANFVINPEDHVVITLLQVVLTDLEMCYRNLLPTIKNEITAIGHLNNAQSALKRAKVDPAYSPLITEIHTRISKVKFYLLMQDFNGVKMRLQQLVSIIKNILSVQFANKLNIPEIQYNYNLNYSPNTHDAPVLPKEIPVTESLPSPNQNHLQNINHPMPLPIPHN